MDRLIPHPRETYLRQNETRIRSQAAAIKTDPLITRHLTYIESAEDLHDYHEAVIAHFEKQGSLYRIPPHERYKESAIQLKLHHLDQLANLIL